MRWSRSLLPRTYVPNHAQNKMKSEGNLRHAHAEFKTGKRNNLRALLQNRYQWMNNFIEPGDIVVEIGAGAGFSK